MYIMHNICLYHVTNNILGYTYSTVSNAKKTMSIGPKRQQYFSQTKSHICVKSFNINLPCQSKCFFGLLALSLPVSCHVMHPCRIFNPSHKVTRILHFLLNKSRLKTESTLQYFVIFRFFPFCSPQQIRLTLSLGYNSKNINLLSQCNLLRFGGGTFHGRGAELGTTPVPYPSACQQIHVYHFPLGGLKA